MKMLCHIDEKIKPRKNEGGCSHSEWKDVHKIIKIKQISIALFIHYHMP